MLTKDQLEAIQKKVWDKFTYIPDKKNYMQTEHWTSHADKVENDEKFKDDCDGFALTCAELLIKGGISKDNVMICYVICENDEAHLVCGCTIETEAGKKTYILENRHKQIYNWDDRKSGPKAYKWLYFMKFSKPGKWRKINK
jgi:predicted transglutaminase-like cysteine proteinase